MWWWWLACVPADVRPGQFEVTAGAWAEADDDCGLVADGFPLAGAVVTLADPDAGAFTLGWSTFAADPLACRLGAIDDLGDPTFSCSFGAASWPAGDDRVGVSWVAEGSYFSDHSVIGGGMRIAASCADDGACELPDEAPFGVLPCASQGVWQAERIVE